MPAPPHLPPGRSKRRGLFLRAMVSWLLLAPLCFLPTFQLLEQLLFDLFSNLAPPLPKETPVVLVGIDESSFAELARQWPWPRDLHARLLARLSEAGAAVIALDVVFAEPSTPDADRALAMAISGAGPVVLAADLAVEETAHLSQLIRVDPLPLLVAAGAETGISAVTLDQDGVLRRLPSYDGSFAATALRAWERANGQTRSVVPVQPRLLQFFGPGHRYPYASYYQALAPDEMLPPDFFRNRIVLVGRVSKTGVDPTARQADTFATPVTLASGELMAGVAVQAVILDNLRLGLLLRPAPLFLQPLGLAIVLFCGFLLFQQWHPLSCSLRAFGAFVLIIAGSFALLRLGRIWMPPHLFLGGVLLSFLGEGGGAYLRELSARRRLKLAFARYLPPVLVERLAADPSQLTLGGETRPLTVMFCDIRGFTTLAETYREEPDRLVQLMNRYFTAMTTVIHDHQGTVDKFIGDGIMAFWNAPLDDPDHPRHGCAAGLAMLARLARFNDELARVAANLGQPPVRLEISIGINSGRCVVGNIGAEQRFDYSVLGDPVNLASRLEGQTRNYGVAIVIGPQTAAAVPALPTLELDLLAVKGKSEPARIFALLSPSELDGINDLPALTNQHAALLAAYRRGDWPAAQASLTACRKLAPGLATLYREYTQRLNACEADPPEAWTGVKVAMNK